MGSKRTPIVLSAFAIALGARWAAAQCPDGSLRQNGQCGGPVIRPTLDSNRVIVLPFSTQGAAPAIEHLGTGLMELLSAELNGAVGPVAVEPGEAYHAWKTVAKPGEPLTRAVALRAAREVGAGQVVMGTVVGAPDGFTVSASIVGAPGGTVRVAPVNVQGSEQRLNALASALATKLIGRSTGVMDSVPSDALRAYLDGMVAYRSPKTGGDAFADFRRAMRLDTTFILPTYRMVLLSQLYGPTTVNRDTAFRAAFPILWRQRSRLSVEQRTLLSALVDSNGSVLRMEALRRLERAKAVLPNSAEAWDILGDLYFHVGAAIGRVGWADSSRRAFSRAIQLDANLCPCSHEHLADLAFLSGDARTFAKYATSDAWQKYQGALLSHDPNAIGKARLDYAGDVLSRMNAEWPPYTSAPHWLNGIPIPAGEPDSIIKVLTSLATNDEQRTRVDAWAFATAFALGRPATGTKIVERVLGGKPTYYSTLLDYGPYDSVLVSRLMSLTDTLRPQTALDGCNAVLARLRQGDTTGASGMLARLERNEATVATLIALRPGNPGPRRLCAQVVRGVLAAVGGGDLAPLYRADSVMRFMPLNIDAWDYDIAVAFARRGEFAMAAAASRRRVQALPTWGHPRFMTALRGEALWSARAGDTASAIRAYREYLNWRTDPEPQLIPQRDSVRAELALLEKATSRRKGTRE